MWPDRVRCPADCATRPGNKTKGSRDVSDDEALILQVIVFVHFSISFTLFSEGLL